MANLISEPRRTVVLHLNLGPFARTGRTHMMQNVALTSALPIRHESMHFFDVNIEESPSTYLVPKGFSNRMAKLAQTRLRFHPIQQYDYKKLHFVLGTFGIPTQVLPVKETGEIDLSYHRQFLEMRAKLEAQQIDEEEELGAFIAVPEMYDVIRGNDAFARNHVGNIRLSNLVDDLFEEYDSVDRLDRRNICKKVLWKVHGYGGRFIEKSDTGQWFECDEEGALEKIGNRFRSLRRHRNKIRNEVSGMQVPQVSANKRQKDQVEQPKEELCHKNTRSFR